MRVMHCTLMVGLVVGLFTATGPVHGSSAASRAQQVRSDIDATLAALSATGDFAAAETALVGQFDRVIALADAEDKALFRDAAFALRLVRQVRELDQTVALDVLAYLRANDALAPTLAFLVKPEHEQPAEVYTLLDGLRRHRGDVLDAYASLAAAICVVHDRPMRRQVNENSARSAGPLALFDYFASNERQMFFGIRNMPAELLIYVVDTTASVDEMLWAMNRYAGDPMVGARFFDIDYDFDHFRKGKPKKVTVEGWNLPNILRYGGVCADQAYFAMSVGKSIGVPTAYASGASSNVSHAWVGFLQARGRQAWWNFDVGRYAEYQGVRGTVLDPQIRKRIPDSYVSLLAELATITPADRQAAAAYTDAALRLVELAEAGEDLTIPGDEQTESAEQSASLRHANVESTLQLIEQGLRISPGYADGWMAVRDLAEAGKLTLAQKKRWAGVLHRLCGERYPDFYLAILGPMIQSIDDLREQNALWNKAFALFRNRHDLAAAVRMAQGQMWEQANEPAKAGVCYEDVIGRYANAGPFVITALRRAEDLLRQAGQGNAMLLLYEQAFSSMKKPPDMAGPFYKQSNFYRVGKLYADRLDEAGRWQVAAVVRGRIGGRKP